MFGILGSLRYRARVNFEVHSILMYVPELGKLLKTQPNLKKATSKFQKLRMEEREAAVRLSLFVIETIMSDLSEDARLLTLQQLDHDDTAHYPKGASGLTFALRSAISYLGAAVREKNLSIRAYKMFVGDVVGMLQGKSQEERRKDLLNIALSSLS